MCAVRRMRGNRAGVVVIVPDHLRARVKQAQQRRAVAVERNVGHHHTVAGAGVDPGQQRNVALDAGYHLVRRVAGQAQLLGGA